MPEPTASSPRVLVVDDEEVARTLFKKHLTLRGFQVEVAEAGEEGIAKVYSYKPHVVLLDVKMPRLTGDELVKMITDWKPEIQVIMVSANLYPELEKECLQNGAYSCIAKPVDFDQLAKTIMEVIK